MKKITIILIMLNTVFLIADNVSRNDAISYFKLKHKNQNKSILMSQYNRDNIDPDYNIDKKYKAINLCWNDTTDEDLKYVKCFPEVRSITLAQAIKIQDEDLKYLSNLSNLQSLDLSETKITGEGFKHLNNLPSLGNIDLTASKVTDKSIQELKKFKTLKLIILCKTKVTQKGVKMLKKELPDCDISTYCQDDGNPD